MIIKQYEQKLINSFTRYVLRLIDDIRLLTMRKWISIAIVLIWAVYLYHWDVSNVNNVFLVFTLILLSTTAGITIANWVRRR
jgi:hypothetical protein